MHKINFNVINRDQIIDRHYVDYNVSSASMTCDGNNTTVFIKKLNINENQLGQLNYWNTVCKGHVNIVEFLGIIKDENEISLILPYADGGNLKEYLKNNKDIVISSRVKIATDITNGVLYIHKDLNLIHENLHPTNILMFGGIAKITDLPLPYNKKKRSYHNFFDTCIYKDPDLLLMGTKKDKSGDIYSLGTLLSEIIKSSDPEFINLCEKCRNKDSLTRPNIDDVHNKLLNIFNNEIEVASSSKQSITEEPVVKKRKRTESDHKRDENNNAQKKKIKDENDPIVKKSLENRSEKSVVKEGPDSKGDGANDTKVKRKRNDLDSEFDRNKVKKTNLQSEKKEDLEISEKKKSEQKNVNDESDDKGYRLRETENANSKNDNAKWNTLEHNGVYFPPEYVPHNVKMKYDGIEVHLEPEAEEVATFYAAYINTEYAENPTFNENFFRDFKEVLAKSNKNPPIEEFNKCDFTLIFNYLEREKEKQKAMSKKEKERLKEERFQLEEKYGFCYLDGQKQKVGNFRIEPPGLFRGRGNNPKTGSLKLRVQPEQVTINIGKGASIPEPPEGHEWKKVIHDNTVTWLASWEENINKSNKRVYLAANSTLKGQSDHKKFEKARELKGIITKIRDDYERDMKNENETMANRQRATAMYFIDHRAFRAGHDEETDAVGCCQLRSEHIELEFPNIVKFDFLGKNSTRYQKDVKVDDQVYKNLQTFKENKTEKDQLFDKISAKELNKHLSSRYSCYMEDLTSKVFRTYRSSYNFQEQLKKTPINGSVKEKIKIYNQANLKVAILCNHQRAVSKTFDKQMNAIENRIRDLKYQRMRLKKTILTLDHNLKKKRPELNEPESDLDEDWCEEYEKDTEEKDKKKIRKKFEKDNDKRKKEGNKPPFPTNELKAKLKKAEEKRKKFAMERKTGKIGVKKNQTVNKVDSQIAKINERIKEINTTKVEKEKYKNISLETSKLNYIDPRISVAWCYRHDVPIDKVFSKRLREKFDWAMKVDKNWEF